MAAFDPADAMLVGAILILAGTVKGIAGFGLPTISLGLMALSRPLPEAMALVLLPTLASNVWQALAGGALGPTLRRLWGFLLAAAAGTLLGAGQIARTDARVLAGLLGLALASSALISLLGPRWPEPGPRVERWLSPVMGGLSGLLAGLTGSFIVPAASWLAALRLPPAIFVQGFGLGAVVATACLSAMLAGQGLLPREMGVAAVAVLIPTFIGMSLGRRLRHRLSETAFRQAVQVLLLALGLYLAVRNLWL